MPSLKEVHSQMVRMGFFDDEGRGRKGRERRCLDVVLEAIEGQVSESKPTLTFVQLPPGYGKTAIPYSLSLWALPPDEVYLERCIHALPLRSIVEDSWRRFRKGLGSLGLGEDEAEGIVGAQCMFTHGSPFLQKGLAITTLDTFALLAAKLPPAELRSIAHEWSQGHYEVARGALLSSAVVYDEVHLLFEEGGRRGYERPLTALLALIRALLRWRVPVVVMTATLPGVWRQELRGWLEEREPGAAVRELTYGTCGLRDEEFEDEVSSVALRTKSLRNEVEYVKEIAEAARSYERVLVIANTIRRAQELYETLKDLSPMLLHSKFTQGDRKSRLDKLEDSRGRWFCISTQVVEAGVDISAQALFTDIAPLCALVQRGGRCRRPSHGDEGEEGKITICVSERALSHARMIYDGGSLDRSREALEKIGDNFNWHSYAEYMPLLDGAYGRSSLRLDQRIDPLQHNQMLKLLLHPYWDARDAFDLLLELGSFTRDEPLVTGVVCEDDDIHGVAASLWRQSKRLLPLELSDVREIAKRREVKLLTADGRGSFSLDGDPGRLLPKFLRGDVVAVQVPPELYDGERGLLV